LHRGYVASLLAVFVLVLLFSFQGYYAAYYSPTIDLLTDAIAAVAALSAFLAMSKYGKGVHTRSGWVWPAFAVGIVSWFLGEVTWSIYYEILQVQIPYPSLADLFYLAGYFPFFIGLYLYIMYFRPVFSLRTFAAVITAIIASAAVVVVFLIGPVLSETADSLTRFFDFAYPLLDLFLLSIAVLGLTMFFSGKLGRAWLFINLGILLRAFADMLFSYTTALGTYSLGSVPDLLFMLSYISLALAFYLHMKEL
jgi:hypothetical protein